MVLVLVLPDSFLSSSRYDEGKMLKGTGTLASKSRLTALGGRAESSSSQPLDKEEKKSPLASSWGKKSKERRIREGPYQLIRTPSVLWGFDRAPFGWQVRWLTWLLWCGGEGEDGGAGGVLGWSTAVRKRGRGRAWARGRGARDGGR